MRGAFPVAPGQAWSGESEGGARLIVMGAGRHHLSLRRGDVAADHARAGLVTGNHYCLALAKQEGAPALTAERRWPRCGGRGCQS